MSFIFAYITTKDKEQALFLGKTLVQEHLCACVNIIDPMTSIYRWEGRIATESETVLIAKTTAEKFDALQNRVKELHSYSCPCVVSIPLTNGSAQYLEWLSDNLR